METTRELLRVFKLMDFGLSKVELFELWLNRNENIDAEIVKRDLISSVGNSNLNWVKMAKETHFVYDSFEVNPEKFDVDDLLIFVDSFNWKDAVHSDAYLSRDQREELKGKFRTIEVQHFENIYELLDDDEFKWLPFEVNHAFKSSFGEMNYINEDIIYYLKTIIWEYLFPNSLDKGRLSCLRRECTDLLNDRNKNSGWIDMSNIVKSLENSYPGIDLYELSMINWDETIQHIKHYSNPFTLGFKRIKK